MLIFTTHNYLLFTRKEIWFYNNEPLNEGSYNSFSAAKTIKGSNTRETHKYNSVLIDLSKTEDEILKAMHPRLQYDLQLAEKVGFQFLAITDASENECISSMNSFNAFAKTKGIPIMKKSWILAARKTKKLFITKILFEEKEVVSHIFLCHNGVALNTHSYHNVNFTIEKAIKFGNKFLHWQDIIYFRNQGYKTYSFGPINPLLKGITQFKMNFGGQLEENYRYLKVSSFLFYCANLMRKILRTSET